MMTFPTICAIAFVGNLLEFYLDKYRMLRICKRPKYVGNSLRKFIIFYLVMVALFSVFTFP